MKSIIAVCLMLCVTSVFGQQPPPNFFFHKDALIDIMSSTWRDIPIPTVIPGLIEKESCITLRHSRCWSRFSELKTSRENGVGLGQLTVAYHADGRVRFSAFDEVRVLDSRLKDWKWEDRYNAQNQMVAVVVMVKRNYHIFRAAEAGTERFAFALAAYNGGIGGIQSDQRICRNTKGCDPNVWFGHTEHTSLKQRTKLAGYGNSFFDINRLYPKDILFVRMMKYKPYINERVLFE